MGKADRLCVVTGGAGFIGSHLVERLLADGLRVRVLDDFSTGRPQNLQSVAGDPRLDVVEVDIAGSRPLAPLFEGVDWVFHLAALADIVPSIERPWEYHRVNVDGTVAVLEGARAAGVRRLIYAASSSCYGVPDSFPTPEGAPSRPQYPYALTKSIGESYVMHWGQVYGLSVASLRFFNVYGPRARTSGSYGAVFGVFLAQKLAGRPFTVVGDGEQTRDFVYVTDVAAACVAAAESDRTGVVYNVGGGNPTSVNRIVELLGSDAGVVNVPKRPGEPDCTFADTSRIRAELGWKPEVAIEDGVARLVDQIDYWSDAPLWDPDSIEEATQTWFRYLSSST
jgi:UDP-glucose 4-epimerase